MRNWLINLARLEGWPDLTSAYIFEVEIRKEKNNFRKVFKGLSEDQWTK